MRWISGDGDRERRHQHHGVADRAQQHAAFDGRGGDPPAPAQAVGRRRELHAAHEPFEADVAHRRLRRDAVVQQVAQLVGAFAHVGEHVPRVEQLEVPQRDRGRERVPAVGMAVVQRALAEVVAEERVGTRGRSRPSPTSAR